jgi:hypothetical protein
VKEIIYFLMNIQWFRKLFRPVDSYFSSLLSILYNYLNEERSPGYGESDPCQYSRLLTCEKSGLELGQAQAAGPQGNLRPEADWPKELARHAKKCYLERESQDRIYKLLWPLGER